MNTEEGIIKIVHSVEQNNIHKLKSCENYFNDFDDPIFSIITSTVTISGETWKKYPRDFNNCALNHIYDEDNLAEIQNTTTTTSNTGSTQGKSHLATRIGTKTNGNKSNNLDNDILDCGKPVNFTYVDDLIGVAERFNHPSIPEPEVAYLFLKKKNGGTKSLKNFDIDALERRLKKAKREKPKSVQLYNQIGNFWRIKGDAKQSIECFRRALAVSPADAEVLLNLARVLFNLQYLDDAIHLTRRSLDVQPPDRNAWQQYLTLGQIFKAYGHFQESILHLRHAHELFPQHEPIKQALRDVENIPSSPLHFYTILIIVCLVMGVLILILSSNDGNQNASEQTEPKVQRHFNRAMAMRSLKGFPPRTLRHRK